MDSLTTRACLVDISFKNIAHAVFIKKSQKIILNNVSGSYTHGKLHAIMGPSGAGKSSLLNVLAGLNTAAKGVVSFNGTKHFTVEKWGDVAPTVRSYIMQDDFLVPELSVQETMMFAAAMKHPAHDRQLHAKIVAQILEQIGLTATAQVAVSGLSGGQRKRLAVATELVNYKPVLFLDEPTTGLDSGSCYRLMDLLKSVAQSGCNVIATIHQPSSRVFSLFDTLTVLGVGGKMAFSGPPAALVGAIKQLTNVTAPGQLNPADLLFQAKGKIIKLMAEAPENVRRKAIESSLAEAVHLKTIDFQVHLRLLEGDGLLPNKDEDKGEVWVPMKSFCDSSEDVIGLCKSNQPKRLEQFKALFRRVVSQTARDKVFFMGRFIAFIMATIIAGITFQNVGAEAGKVFSNVAFLYLLSKIFLLGTCIVAIMNSPTHLQILLRENINNWYSLSSSFWCRTFMEATINILIAVIFSTCMWLMSGQQQILETAIPCIMLVMSLHCIATHHFSFILAMFADEASLPQLPFAVAMLHVVFGGYFVPLHNLPVWISWMRYVDFGSFTYSALLKIAFSPVRSTDPQVEIPCTQDRNPYCGQFRTGDDVLRIWGVNIAQEPLWHDMVALAGYVIGLVLLSWGLLAVYLSKARRTVARI